MTLTGLPRQIVQQDLLDEATVVQAIETAKKEKLTFVQYIVQKKLIKALDVAALASREFGVPLLDINSIEIDPDVVALVKENLITKHQCLPIFKRSNRLLFCYDLI